MMNGACKAQETAPSNLTDWKAPRQRRENTGYTHTSE